MRINLFYYLIAVLIFGCSSPEPETSNTQLKTKSDNNDYYENGNIRIERKHLENGDSLWIFKQEDGGCWEENFYREGEIYRKIVYNSDCTKSAEYELKDGKRHGSWKSYHENNLIRENGQYKNGLLINMMYKDEKGKLIQMDLGHLKDTFEFELYYKKMDYYSLKSELKSIQIIFKETENIKVAGNDEYHFPTLSWDKNELNFDRIEQNDTVKCLSGKITDNRMPIFKNNKSIQFGQDLITVCSKLKVGAPHETNNVYVYDLKEKMTYRFEFENKKLVAIYFEGTNLAY